MSWLGLFPDYETGGTIYNQELAYNSQKANQDKFVEKVCKALDIARDLEKERQKKLDKLRNPKSIYLRKKNGRR